MATLSSTTAATRKVLKIAGIGLAALLIVMLFYRLVVFVQGQITPPPPPTVAFGKLDQISFPESKTSKTLSYSIDTVTGVLPVFSDRANVYKTVPPAPDLLALDKAAERVRNVGFDGSYFRLSTNVYQWSKKEISSTLERKIAFNIFSGDFNLSSPFLTDPNVIAGNNLPNQTAAVSLAEGFLSGMSAITDDIDIEKTQASLFSIKNGNIVPAVSLASSQILRVSFFQKDLGGFPVVYPTADSSTITVLVGGGANSPQVVEADFFHQSVASESATYPILSTSQAFEKLKNGEGYIASYDDSSSKISINKVTLAYFLSDSAQTYVMPVVVFKGSSGFTAYVSAVRDDWIQK